MRIPGFVFLLIGAVVAIASYVLIHQGQKMQLFMYFGIAMAVYGAIRLYIDREEKPSSEAERRAKLAAELPQMRSRDAIPRVCSVCSTRNNPKANFCGHCGNKL
jgi:hypothetical protein